MRLTVVADNSTELNWGCRGTSFAFRQLLSLDHKIVGVITRELLRAPLAVTRLGSPRMHRMLVRGQRRQKIAAVPLAGALAGRLVDALGDVHQPGHDIGSYADALWNNRATSPEAAKIVAAIEACDAIAVNGEGEMIFATPARPTLLQTLAICELARRRGKRVFYLNGMISPAPDGSVNKATVAAAAATLRGATVAVRDPHSQQVAHDLLPDLAPDYFADSLFSWRSIFASGSGADYDAARVAAFFDRTGAAMPDLCAADYIVLSGSSQAAHFPDRAVPAYTRLASELKTLGLPILLIPTCTGDGFLARVATQTGLPLLPVTTSLMAGAAVLANARLMVSGRWHPSIMASLGGTPSVFMGSNSHKTLTLQHMLEYDDIVEYGAIPSDDDITAIVRRSRTLLSDGLERRRTIAATVEKLDRSANDLRGYVR